jgi:PRTRC genetic system protein B
MTHHVETLVEQERYDLAEAILLYRCGQRDAYATVHDVTPALDGTPVVGAGAPLSRERLRNWTKALRSEPPLAFIPDTILARSAEALVWWIPAAVREAYFSLNKKSSTGLTILAKKTVRKVPYPPLLLAAVGDQLLVHALRANRRPTPETPLYRSPILNVDAAGALCWGSIPRPALEAPDVVAQLERALFESWSTHPNDAKNPAVDMPGGTPALWEHLIATKAKTFPTKVLKPHTRPIGGRARTRPMTLADLIASIASL